MKKGLMFLSVLALLMTAATSFAKGKTDVEDEWLEYSVYYGNPDGNVSLVVQDNPNDVVTPYIEEKWKVRVKEIYQSVPDMNLEAMLNQWVAAGNMPDVILGPPDMSGVFKAKEKFADLTDYVRDYMPNYRKYMSDVFWPDFSTDGRIYGLPAQRIDYNHPMYAEDPYNPGTFLWGLWLREDILGMAGYDFTPVDEIEANAAAANRRPTIEDFAINPSIDKPEDLYTYLKKVQALALDVEGKPVIPLSIDSWQQFHVGCMYDFGWWTLDEKTGNVGGYLGSPGAKDYYRFLVKLYREGLLDNDFLIQKEDQLQEKVASGRVGAGMYVPDPNAAAASLAEIVPGAKLRYIRWPKVQENKGFYDVFYPPTEPGKTLGYNVFMIRNDFPDIERLVTYFDWFLTEEAMDIIVWGPESAGLWEMKDGKKVFKDPAIRDDFLNGARDGKGANYWGLYDDTFQGISWSQAVVCVPTLDCAYPNSWRRSYPPNLSMLDLMKNVLGGNGVSRDGLASYGDNGPNAGATADYFWAEFQGNKCAALFQTETDAEFDKEWDRLYAEFLEKGQYAAAVEDMKKWFENYRTRYADGWSFFED